MIVELVVDGETRVADVDPAVSLLTLLREKLDVTAVKNACEEGECGSCTVSLDGRLACSCLVPAVQADGAEVRTAAAPGNGLLAAVQEALLETGAVQCGFCTPGFVVTIADLLEHEPHPSDHEVREALSGNVCRCTGYRKVLEAVRVAERRLA